MISPVRIVTTVIRSKGHHDKHENNGKNKLDPPSTLYHTPNTQTPGRIQKVDPLIWDPSY